MENDPRHGLAGAPQPGCKRCFACGSSHPSRHLLAIVLVAFVIMAGWLSAADARPAPTASASASAAVASSPDAGDGGINDAGVETERARQWRQTAQHIRELIAVELAPEVEPSSLFDVALDDESALALERKRLEALLLSAEARSDAGPKDAEERRPLASRRKSAKPAAPAEAEPRQAGDAGAEAGVDAAAAEPEPPDPRDWAARLELDRARLAFYSLPRARRTELLARHARRQQEREQAQSARALTAAESKAKSASEAQQEALREAGRARTEAKRLLIEERARLLGVKVELAQFEADLARRRQALDQAREGAFGWRRRVNDLIERRRNGQAGDQDADRLYPELRSALRGLRAELRDALSAVTAPSSVPVVGQDPLSDLPAEVDRTEVDDVRREVTALSTRVEQDDAQLRWTRATLLRELVGSLDEGRLALYPYLSSDQRTKLTSFSAYGWDQASAEGWQVSLVLRQRVLAARRWVGGLWSGEGGRTEAVFLGIDLLKILGLFVVLWWLQRRLGPLIASLRARFETPMLGADRTSRAGGDHVLLVADRVRRPLGWLVATWLALVIMGAEVSALLEVQLLWILVSWNLGGVLVVNLIDALAAGHDVADARRPTAELRLRSLKLVGRVVVIIGLTLALTSHLVGRGTIYNWVLSTCWFLAVPVALWIVIWWRRVIFERLEPRVEASTLAAWVVARKDRWTSLVAATVGGVFLLGQGTARAVARYVSGFVITRRLLAYLFRREIAKQTRRQEVEGALSPYPRKKCAEFDPDTRATELLPTAADADLQSVLDVIDAPGGGVFALVGERGSGKSTLLRRIVDEHPHCLRLRCPTGGLTALLADLRQLLELATDATAEQIRTALDTRAEDHALLIDDCQRLVVPTINGLRDLDALLEMARTSSATCAWVLAFDSALWEFVQRARGVRPQFDEVLVIRPWPEEVIAALVRQRSSQAGLKPRFDHLLPPGNTNEYRRAEQLVRTEAGYYRLLWDYSTGNPAVALRFWCHSLYLDGDGEVFVQLFATPEMADLEGLPDATVFVLRAVMQLEPVRISDLALATRISAREVEEAVRYARVRGYLNADGDRVRLSWDWYRAVSRLLQRRHLLALPGSA